MNPIQNARRFRSKQTKRESQLWRSLRAGRFAGFKFRRQHPVGRYCLDFYCPLARLSVELDGFEHGMPGQRQRDLERERYLAAEGILELRFWNRQWRKNREGVLPDIWCALAERTGCVLIQRQVPNQRYVPPDPRQLTSRPTPPPMWYPPGTAPPD